MKTSTSEVLCDQCHQVIPLGSRAALFVTIRGILVGHKKADLCNWACLALWAAGQAKART